MKRIIYQVLPRLWGNGKLSDWDDRAFAYVKSLGADYIWYTGIPRHASGAKYVKGNPGSPYAIIDWYDVNPYLADNEDLRMSEFENLIKRTHDSGLKCIIDYIPNHVANGYSGTIPTYPWFDGDWSDTKKVNWSDPATVPEMIKVLRFWAEKGVDGFRCDMVEMVPPESLAEVIAAIKKEFPGRLFVAEVYGKDNYRKYLADVGFDLLYDKSGMYDTLRSIVTNTKSAREITWNWQFLGSMQPMMLNFLENHDEQRLASPWFAGCATKGIAALAASLLFNTASFMLYFGQEVGENAAEGHEGRTSIFNFSNPLHIGALCRHIYGNEPLPSEDGKLLERYRELLALSKEQVFAEGNNWDICYCNYDSPGFDEARHFAFIRYMRRQARLVFCNFSAGKAVVKLKIPIELKNYTSMDYIEVSAEPFDAVVISLNNTLASN